MSGSTAGNGYWKSGEQYRRDGTASTVFDLTVLDRVSVGGRQLEGRCVLAGLHWCKLNAARAAVHMARAHALIDHCQRLSVSLRTAVSTSELILIVLHSSTTSRLYVKGIHSLHSSVVTKCDDIGPARKLPDCFPIIKSSHHSGHTLCPCCLTSLACWPQ